MLLLLWLLLWFTDALLLVLLLLALLLLVWACKLCNKPISWLTLFDWFVELFCPLLLFWGVAGVCVPEFPPVKKLKACDKLFEPIVGGAVVEKGEANPETGNSSFPVVLFNWLFIRDRMEVGDMVPVFAVVCWLMNWFRWTWPRISEEDVRLLLLPPPREECAVAPRPSWFKFELTLDIALLGKPETPTPLTPLTDNCWILFLSLSFCVSANFTTIFDDTPSKVRAWCMFLTAFWASILFSKVTKAHPRLCPSCVLKTLHSSILPKIINNSFTCSSFIFFEIIPTNNFLSSFFWSVSAGFIWIGWCMPGRTFILCSWFLAVRAASRV